MFAIITKRAKIHSRVVLRARHDKSIFIVKFSTTVIALWSYNLLWEWA